MKHLEKCRMKSCTGCSPDAEVEQLKATIIFLEAQVAALKAQVGGRND
jgi:hypothetical protein